MGDSPPIDCHCDSYRDLSQDTLGEAFQQGVQILHASLVVFLVPQLNGEALLLLFSFARLAHCAFLAVERGVVRRGSLAPAELV
jgi:hypothetical protein